jgi:hypothetical protein
MEIVSRRGWNARAPRSGIDTVAPSRRTEFVVHHSGGPVDQTPREIQDWCMDGRKFKDVDYNFLVNQDGKIFEGRGWNAVGSHTVGHNTTGIGVCVIGDNKLSAAAANALRRLYEEACRRSGKRLTPHVHGDLDQTSCPGTVIRLFVHRGGLAAPTPATARRNLEVTAPPMEGEDVKAVQRKVGAKVDGVYGPDTKRLVMMWQDNHSLATDGIVGPKTRASMRL